VSIFILDFTSFSQSHWCGMWWWPKHWCFSFIFPERGRFWPKWITNYGSYSKEQVSQCDLQV